MTTPKKKALSTPLPQSSEEVWDALHRLAAAIEDQQDELYALVVKARSSKVNLTWREIADAVGITRQAAWERFTQVRRSGSTGGVHQTEELPL